MSESQPRSAPEPKNPLYFETKKMQAFMRRLKNAAETPDGGYYQYVGSEDLRDLIAKDQIAVGSIIRMTWGPVHTFHILTPFGLVNYLDKKHEVSTYEEVLDQKEMGHRNHWIIDGFDFLSKETLEELKKGSKSTGLPIE